MNILSFDTTNNLASVAIINDEQILSYITTDESSQQAEKLFLLIEQCLSKSSLKISDLDLVSLTNGPGSFTGVRIGIAAALGMKIGINIPFIALTNFQVLAFAAQKMNIDRDIAVILDARRDQVYFQLFNHKLEHLDEPRLISIDNIDNYLSPEQNFSLIGDGVGLIKSKYLSWKVVSYEKANACLLAEASNFFWQKKIYHDLIPLYIREPDVSLPKSK